MAADDDQQKRPTTPPPLAVENDAPSSSSSSPEAPRGNDVVLLGPPTADGTGVHVLRARDERIETGELRNLEEGRPVTGEIVTLAPRKDNPRVCDVKASYTPPKSYPPPPKLKGPAQVATKEYRDNWDEVFKSASKKPSELN